VESRLKLLGHPVHPMLVIFPLGLFVTAVIFDFTDLVGGPSLLGVAAYWNIVAGLISGLVVLVAGTVELLILPRGTRTKRFAAAHLMITVGVLASFAASWWVRMPSAERGANGGLFALEALAVLACGVGAWLRTEPAGRFGAWADRRVRLPEAGPRAARAGTVTRPHPATVMASSTTARTVRLTSSLLAAARRPAAN
jgi:uncharacterized membrane protein